MTTWLNFSKKHNLLADALREKNEGKADLQLGGHKKSLNPTPKLCLEACRLGILGTVMAFADWARVNSMLCPP